MSDKAIQLVKADETLEALLQTVKVELNEDYPFNVDQVSWDVKSEIVCLNDKVLKHPMKKEIEEIVADYKADSTKRDFYDELLKIIYYNKGNNDHSAKKPCRIKLNRVSFTNIADYIIDSLVELDYESFGYDGNSLEGRIAQIYAEYVLENYPNLI